MNLLYVRLDAALFESIHGPLIAALARRDLGKRLAAALELVLRQHRPLTRVVSPRFGIWGVLFELKRHEIESEPAEQRAAIEAAARELAASALEREAGAAVALYTRVEARVTRWDAPPDEAGLSAALARIARAPVAPRPPDPQGLEEARRAAGGLGLSALLQPVVSLDGYEPVGFEALGRGPEGRLRAPERLFDACAAAGLRAQLELALLDAALALAPRLPPPLFLAVNLSPGPSADAALRRLAASRGLVERLVLEVTEHLPIASPRAFAERLSPLRARGARLALDDAGCGFLNMELVRALRPDIVKLCITVTSRLGRGPEVVDEVASAVAGVREEGAIALAEGVETADQARRARDCGFALAQGFLFGRPLPAEAALARLTPEPAIDQ